MLKNAILKSITTVCTLYMILLACVLDSSYIPAWMYVVFVVAATWTLLFIIANPYKG